MGAFKPVLHHKGAGHVTCLALLVYKNAVDKLFLLEGLKQLGFLA